VRWKLTGDALFTEHSSASTCSALLFTKGKSKMPKITSPVSGPGPTTSSFPADQITHKHHSPKGEDASSYRQIEPNPQAKRDAVQYGKAIPRGNSHGSASFGGKAGELGNAHASGDASSYAPRYRGPDPSCGIKRGGRGSTG
jgi:hypothetical protein